MLQLLVLLPADRPCIERRHRAAPIGPEQVPLLLLPVKHRRCVPSTSGYTIPGQKHWRVALWGRRERDACVSCPKRRASSPFRVAEQQPMYSYQSPLAHQSALTWAWLGRLYSWQPVRTETLLADVQPHAGLQELLAHLPGTRVP